MLEVAQVSGTSTLYTVLYLVRGCQTKNRKKALNGLVADELMSGGAETPTAANDIAVHKEHPKKHKNHLSKTLSRLLYLRRGKDASADKVKLGDNDNDEASVATTAAETTCSSLCSSVEDEDGIPVIQTRLFESGIVASTEDCVFVVDKVSKEVVNNFSDADRENDDPNMAHVKTGIWQVTCLNDDGTPQDPLHIVTGICMQDKVDTKKLRKAVFAGKTLSRRPKLSLAPTEIAEKLTGFQSGTMAPICHTVDMKLFLEESIIAKNIDTTTHKINVGSGMFGKCLPISTDKFLEIVKANPKGVEACSLTRTSKATRQGKIELWQATKGHVRRRMNFSQFYVMNR